MTEFARKIFVALDTTDLQTARQLAGSVARAGGSLKIGLTFFCAHGPAGTRDLIDHARDQASTLARNQAGSMPAIFLDLKLHDIPNTVAGAVEALAPLAPDVLTLHAGGGLAMMKAAQKKVEDLSLKTRLAAVSVLTSLDQTDLAQLGILGDSSDPVANQVTRLAALAQRAGIGAGIAAPSDLGLLRQTLGPDFRLICPGIRPAGADLGDQKRVLTPKEALAAGADYLVIGRPVTAAADPVAAFHQIVASITQEADQ